MPRRRNNVNLGLQSSLVDVLLWGLAQYADPTVEAIRDRWGVDRATSFRWRTMLADTRARWQTMQRSRRAIEVCGRSAVVADAE